jgi:WD40 repeat protein
LGDEEKPADALAFSPQEPLLAIGRRDGSVLLWNPDTATVRDVLAPQDGPVRSVAFDPTGRKLVVASGHSIASEMMGEVKVWDLATRAATELPLPRLAYYTASFQPGLKSTTLGLAAGREVVTWDVEANREQVRRRPHICGPVRLAYSPDGRWLASASSAALDQRVFLWDLHSAAEPICVPGLSGVKALTWSPDSSLLALSGLQATAEGSASAVWLLQPTESPRVRSLQLRGCQANALAFASTPDCRLLVGCSTGKVRSWKLSDLLN